MRQLWPFLTIISFLFQVISCRISFWMTEVMYDKLFALIFISVTGTWTSRKIVFLKNQIVFLKNHISFGQDHQLTVWFDQRVSFLTPIYTSSKTSSFGIEIDCWDFLMLHMTKITLWSEIPQGITPWFNPIRSGFLRACKSGGGVGGRGWFPPALVKFDSGNPGQMKLGRLIASNKFYKICNLETEYFEVTS